MRIQSPLKPIVVFLLGLALAASGCGRDARPLTGPPVVVPSVKLKDIVIPNLPSPFYHFEYDTLGRISVASFASGLTNYNLKYDGGRLSEMQNNIIVNKDRLIYFYDDVGRVSNVRYTDSTGLVYAVVFLTYNGQKLTAIERDRRVAPGFIVDKTMSLSYDADGNLLELTEHHPSIDGQPATTVVDRFEQYDEKTNVDAFSLIHSEFFDHLVLLPGVELQKGNPARVTHTGDGVNYLVDYTYTYDDQNRPLTKHGELVFTNGTNAGQRFQTNSFFSYY